MIPAFLFCVQIIISDMRLKALLNSFQQCVLADRLGQIGCRSIRIEFHNRLLIQGAGQDDDRNIPAVIILLQILRSATPL